MDRKSVFILVFIAALMGVVYIRTYGGSYSVRARRHLNERRYDEAIENFRMAIREDPTDVDARLGLGQAYVSKIEAARRRVILGSLGGESASVSHRQRRIEDEIRRSGIYEQARKEYEKVLELDPGNFEALVSVGLFYAEGGMHEESVMVLEQAVESYPEHPEHALARFRLGLALAYRGMKQGNPYRDSARYNDIERSLEEIEKAFELDSRLEADYSAKVFHQTVASLKRQIDSAERRAERRRESMEEELVEIAEQAREGALSPQGTKRLFELYFQL